MVDLLVCVTAAWAHARSDAVRAGPRAFVSASRVPGSSLLAGWWSNPVCPMVPWVRIPQGIRIDLAERVGFEPTGPVRDRRFSRPVHSTALPPLRGRGTRAQATAKTRHFPAF